MPPKKCYIAIKGQRKQKTIIMCPLKYGGNDMNSLKKVLIRIVKKILDKFQYTPDNDRETEFLGDSFPVINGEYVF